MKGGEVARPRKKSEYRIVFAERSAEKGWRDLVATTRNAVTDAWDFLTKTPTVHLVRVATAHPNETK